MGKIKIYSDLKSGKVSFEGSRVKAKDIGSLEAIEHPSISNRIIVKSLRQYKSGSDTEFRVFFKKLNINRIENKDGQQLTAAPLLYDRAQVLEYLSTQFTKPQVQEYFEYDAVLDRLIAQKDIQVDKNGFFIGEKHKMADKQLTLVCVRHGQADHNVEGNKTFKFTDEENPVLDTDLTDVGRQHA